MWPPYVLLYIENHPELFQKDVLKVPHRLTLETKPQTRFRDST